MIKTLFLVLSMSFWPFSQNMSVPLNAASLIKAGTRTVDLPEIFGLEPILPLSIVYFVGQLEPFFAGSSFNLYSIAKTLDWLRQKEKLVGLVIRRTMTCPVAMKDAKASTVLWRVT